MTPEQLAELRSLAGRPVPLTHRPHVEFATADTVRAFARGSGDDDPRWDAAQVGDAAVAPPLFPLATGSPAEGESVVHGAATLPAWLRARHVEVVEDRWHFGPPVPLGTRLVRRDEIAAVDAGGAATGTVADALVHVTVRATYTAGAVQHATHDRTRSYATTPPIAEARTKHRYTDAEIEAIADEVRASAHAATRASAAGVRPGAQLGPLVKGPLTVTDLVAYRGGVGAGPFDVEPLELAVHNRDRRPSFYDRTDTNAWDARERLHWDEAYAVSCGHPSAYDYSHTRLVWASQLLTRWMPAGARLASITCRLFANNYVGDTHWLRAEVTAVCDGRAQLAWRADNQWGRTTASGEAELTLG